MESESGTICVPIGIYWSKMKVLTLKRRLSYISSSWLQKTDILQVLGQFWNLVLWGILYLFLTQNLVGNPKKEFSIQNLVTRMRNDYYRIFPIQILYKMAFLWKINKCSINCMNLQWKRLFDHYYPLLICFRHFCNIRHISPMIGPVLENFFVETSKFGRRKKLLKKNNTFFWGPKSKICYIQTVL